MCKIDDYLLEGLALFMDDEIREAIHDEFAPCTNETFLKEYVKRDPEYKEMLKSEYGIDIEEV